MESEAIRGVPKKCEAFFGEISKKVLTNGFVYDIITRSNFQRQ
jgi:hypothetical protein